MLASGLNLLNAIFIAYSILPIDLATGYLKISLMKINKEKQLELLANKRTDESRDKENSSCASAIVYIYGENFNGYLSIHLSFEFQT